MQMHEYENFIVVGADCTGKTTLINLLSDAKSLEVIKGSSFEQSKLPHDQLLKNFEELAGKRDIIFDRFIYCNYVYATLYEDYAILTEDERRHIESLLSPNTCIIYLHAPTEVLKERLALRGDEYVDGSNFDEIKSLYSDVLTEIGMNIPVFTFDTSILTAEQIVSFFENEEDEDDERRID